MQLLPYLSECLANELAREIGSLESLAQSAFPF